MKDYSIKAFSIEERDKIKAKVESFGVTGVKTDSIVGTYYVEFKCSKSLWKEIKNALGLETYRIYAKRKIDI